MSEGLRALAEEWGAPDLRTRLNDPTRQEGGQFRQQGGLSNGVLSISSAAAREVENGRAVVGVIQSALATLDSATPAGAASSEDGLAAAPPGVASSEGARDAEGRRGAQDDAPRELRPRCCGRWRVGCPPQEHAPQDAQGWAVTVTSEGRRRRVRIISVHQPSSMTVCMLLRSQLKIRSVSF